MGSDIGVVPSHLIPGPGMILDTWGRGNTGLVFGELDEEVVGVI